MRVVHKTFIGAAGRLGERNIDLHDEDKENNKRLNNIIPNSTANNQHLQRNSTKQLSIALKRSKTTDPARPNTSQAV